MKREREIKKQSEIYSYDEAYGWLESAIRPYMGYSDICDFVDNFRKVMKK